MKPDCSNCKNFKEKDINKEPEWLDVSFGNCKNFVPKIDIKVDTESKSAMGIPKISTKKDTGWYSMKEGDVTFRFEDKDIITIHNMPIFIPKIMKEATKDQWEDVTASEFNKALLGDFGNPINVIANLVAENKWRILKKVIK